MLKAMLNPNSKQTNKDKYLQLPCVNSAYSLCRIWLASASDFESAISFMRLLFDSLIRFLWSSGSSPIMPCRVASWVMSAPVNCITRFASDPSFLSCWSWSWSCLKRSSCSSVFGEFGDSPLICQNIIKDKLG